MNPILRARILFSLGALGIFLLGMTTGSLTTLGLAKKRIAERLQSTPGENADTWMNKLDRQLDLTDVQKNQFRPVVEESLRDLQTVRRRSFAATRQILENAESQLLPQLSAPQQEAYDKLKKQRREKISQFMGHREPTPAE